MKEFVWDGVTGFQNATLLKVNFSIFTFQSFVSCLGNLFQGTNFNGCFRHLFLQSVSSVL